MMEGESENSQKVTWIFRRRRPLGNFSIESSFSEMMKRWPSGPKPRWHELTHFSTGVMSRLRAILEARKLKSNLIHITGDVYYCAYAFSRKTNGPILVATIHDVGYLEGHSKIKSMVIKELWFTGPLKRINHLITVSEATKREVLREAPWFDPTKITVIPTVVPQHFKSRTEQPKNPKPVALHIGLAENKNLRRHAAALEGLDVHLKIIGEPFPSDFALLKRHNIDFSWQSKLTDEQMQEAYATSDFLLFASTLEGFGMPIIEAQMVGLPVITSDVDPMREVAGDAALLCDPLDTLSIRASIEEVIGNPEKREGLIQKGFVNCNKYAPATSAAMLDDLYKRLLNP